MVTGRKTRPVDTVSRQGSAEPDAEVFALRLRLERALSDHADLYQQVLRPFDQLLTTQHVR